MKTQIRMLTPDDSHTFIEHHVRNEISSDAGSTFLVFSPREASPISERVESAKRQWTKSTDQHGWSRSWGAFVKDDAGIEKIIGSIALSTSRLTPSQRHRAILGIGIEPEFRHLGLGKQLMKTALAWAKQSHFLEWIDLGVFAHNASARRLYEYFGFIENGRTVDCFRVDGHSLDDIQMSLNLRQFDDLGNSR